MIKYNSKTINDMNFDSRDVVKVYRNDEVVYEQPTIDYEKKYFTMVALENGSFGLTIPSGVTTTLVTSVSYSTDNGKTWTTTNNVSDEEVRISINVQKGDKVLWKGIATQLALNTAVHCAFTATAQFNLEGNVMSLLNGDNFYNSSFAVGSSVNFGLLFYENTRIYSAENLIIPRADSANNAFRAMFNGSSIVLPPKLPATTLSSQCYRGMFLNCKSLIRTPELPATTLAISCYYQMFNACTSLVEACVLKAPLLTTYSYYRMFDGCTKLKKIECLATNISATDCLNNWVRNVASKGTFIKNPQMEDWTIGSNGIPQGWMVEDSEPDYETMYFTTVARTSGVIRFTMFSSLATQYYNYIEYSTDNGKTWTTVNNVDNESIEVMVNVNASDRVLWRGSGTTMASSSSTNYQARFINETTAEFDVEGNIMSLLNGDNFIGTRMTSTYSFHQLFNGCRDLFNAKNLILPQNTTQHCYRSMFLSCSNLITAPELPATALAVNCYRQMFDKCTSLTKAPYLRATRLEASCYYLMFRGCTNLNYIKCAAKDNMDASSALGNWVSGVTTTNGTFIKARETEYERGDNGIPTGWLIYNENTSNLGMKYIFTLNDDSVVSADCDASSTITTADTSAYQSTLVKAEIGDCVTEIGVASFTDYITLKSVKLPNTVTTLMNSAFRGCTSITKVVVPKGVITLNANTFRGCTNLESIIFPNNLQTIGTNGIYFCSSLTSATIPSSVTTIGDNAFRACSSLTYVKVLATTPPTLGTNVFNTTNDCPIYVPSESVNAYKTATNWSSYASRIQPIA